MNSQSEAAASTKGIRQIVFKRLVYIVLLGLLPGLIHHKLPARFALVKQTVVVGEKHEKPKGEEPLESSVSEVTEVSQVALNSIQDVDELIDEYGSPAAGNVEQEHPQPSTHPTIQFRPNGHVASGRAYSFRSTTPSSSNSGGHSAAFTSPGLSGSFGGGGPTGNSGPGRRSGGPGPTPLGTPIAKPDPLPPPMVKGPDPLPPPMVKGPDPLPPPTVKGPDGPVPTPPGTPTAKLDPKDVPKLIYNIDQDSFVSLFFLEIGGTLVDGQEPDEQQINTATDDATTNYNQINIFGQAKIVDSAKIFVNFRDIYPPTAGDFFDIITGNTIIANLLTIDFQIPELDGISIFAEIVSRIDRLTGKVRQALRLSVVAKDLQLPVNDQQLLDARVTVPEPSSWLLMLLGMLLLTGIRRYRKI